MTIQEQALWRRFEGITERIMELGDPNDFSHQLPVRPISFDPEGQSMLCSFSVEKRFGNPYGVLHGGIAATMMDNALGASIGVFVQKQGHFTTASLQLSYLRPVRTGEPLYVRTKMNQIGHTMAFCSAEAWQTDGELAVAASAIYHLGNGNGEVP